jgi:Na+/pantothenate symporter
VSRAHVAVALLLYLGTLVGVGAWARRRHRSFADYVTGAGTIPTALLAMSFLGNFVSSNSFVGHAGRSYETGLIWFVVAGVMVACYVVSWTVLAPRMARFARETGATTLPDFFAHHLGSRRITAAVHWIVVLATLLYVLAVMRGTATVVRWGLGIGYVEALVVLYAVTVAYCAFGGMWADVSTDLVQTVLLFAGAIALFAGVSAAAGRAPALAAAPLREPPLGLVLAVGLGGGVKLLIDPKQVAVFYGIGSERAARRWAWIGPIALAAIYACLFPVGYLARRVLGGSPDLEQIVPMLVFERRVLGDVFTLLFPIALLAASMSSLDSAFLVIAACLEKHVAAPLLRREPSTARTRWLLLAAATVALLLSIRPLGGIIRLTTFSGALLGAALLPALCAGLFGLRVTPRAVAWSIGAGVCGTLLGAFGPKLGVSSPWFQDVFVGLGLSTAVLAASALWPAPAPVSG